MNPSQVAGRTPLAVFYFLYFGTVGITQPFLPAYLRSLDLSTSQVGLLLALSPLMSLVTPPVWGHLADRTGQIGRILTVLAVGATLCFAPLLKVDHFLALLATLAAFAAFSSSITPMVDSLALNRVAQVGGSYAHLRLFGSLGFVVITTSFGLMAQRVDARIVAVPLALLGLLALWSFTLHGRSASGASRHPLAGFQLLRGNTDLRWMLAATCLHWMACTPYNGMLAIHVLSLGLPPSVVGLSAGTAVTAEVAAMLLYPRFADRIAPRHLLCVAFGLSALRWLGMAFVTSALPLIALALVHSLTFGIFYVASVAFMARRIPVHLRATGQGLFSAITMGIGGLVGSASSGVGYALLGGHGLFAVAAGLEVVAALLVLQVSPPLSPPPDVAPVQAPAP
ncbi:MFS transporter [Stigmatella erecta]|uniref:MFS transporter, PPP family, 3-phenylpropionic acid transporter n=1 Tax=Stigmatella erecta TaxID=83460 RepID=A0A1I0L347_9BACT|nr:MFS transporter [Stigmatella erecta]SEU32888.1 MFS transporter, PPP family, 3-phenylpropionic acid transporter [Stigmatella erecta]